MYCSHELELTVAACLKKVRQSRGGSEPALCIEIVEPERVKTLDRARHAFL